MLHLNLLDLVRQLLQPLQMDLVVPLGLSLLLHPLDQLLLSRLVDPLGLVHQSLL